MDPYLSTMYRKVWKDLHGEELPVKEPIPSGLENAVQVAVSNFILVSKRTVSYSDADDSDADSYGEGDLYYQEDDDDDYMSTNEEGELEDQEPPVPEYVYVDRENANDILKNLCSAEEIPREYMDTQEELTPAMRALLIDWLVEVSITKYTFTPDTLYLCVNILDRYFASGAQITRQNLQLVGVTALWIADKYEEYHPVDMDTIVYNITDGMVTSQEVLAMERTIATALDFKLKVPTAYHFLKIFLEMSDVSEYMAVAANYYLERTLQEYDFVHCRPSLVALAAMTLAMNNTSITHEYSGLPSDLLDFTENCGGKLMDCIDRVCLGSGRRRITTAVIL